MKRIARERDRLLRLGARAVGFVGDVTTFACLLVIGIPGTPLGIVALGALAALAACHWQLGRSTKRFWSIAILVVGAICFVAIALAFADDVDGLPLVSSAAAANALTPLVAASIGSLAILLVSRSGRVVVLGIGALAVLAGIALLLPPDPYTSFYLLVLACWTALALLGVWLSATVPRTMRRIDGIGQAHRVERQASETEAQRRQGARLLHDTVLATLTLLAHSGVGVSTSALRQQADEDARLLRQLRLGASPDPTSSGSYQLTSVADAPVGQTLESVKGRFGRMGLDVMWHGSGQIELSGGGLDSFLLALAECLENVRRHSGVREADVTITEDDTTLRAMVTDAGVGFDIRAVDAAKLGFKESVVARLADVGGNARLFSSPGAGTTVVLEVPK